MKRMRFDLWKNEVKKEMKKVGFTVKAIASVDWSAFKETYWEDFYMSPKEAVKEDLSALL